MRASHLHAPGRPMTNRVRSRDPGDALPISLPLTFVLFVFVCCCRCLKRRRRSDLRAPPPSLSTSPPAKSSPTVCGEEKKRFNFMGRPFLQRLARWLAVGAELDNIIGFTLGAWCLPSFPTHFLHFVFKIMPRPAESKQANEKPKSNEWINQSTISTLDMQHHHLRRLDCRHHHSANGNRPRG